MDFLTTYEYVTTPADSVTVLRRSLFLALYGAVTAGLLALGFFSGFIIPSLVLTPLLLWALVWLTWRFTRVEYEYSITAGVAVFSRIYGGSNRKTVATLRLRDAAYILPAREGEEILARFKPDEKIDFSAPPCPDASADEEKTVTYLLLWEEGHVQSAEQGAGTAFAASDDDTCAHKVHPGKRHALRFEATEDALKLCRFYFPATKITK